MKKKNAVIAVALSASMVISQGSMIFAGHNQKNISSGQVNEKIESAAELLKGKKYVKGELLVSYDDEMSNGKIEDAITSGEAKCKEIFDANDKEKAAIVKISKDDSMKGAIERFQKDRRVVSVQPNYIYKIRKSETADDSNYTDSKSVFYQYFIKSVKAREAWKILGEKPKAKTKVAVIDTGVDAKHEDLQANVKFKDGKYKAFVNKTEKDAVYDAGEHGTHVTGIIGATYGNGKGGFGVASGEKNNLCEIMVVGTSEDGESLTSADIISAINYSVENNAKVINMSFGIYSRDRLQGKAIRDGYYKKGVVFVGASGNENSQSYSEPAGMKEVISVGATASDDKRWSLGNAGGSNYGDTLDILAPGARIVSTLPASRYGKMSGTSMASPVVAAVAALMLDANPDLTPQNIKNIMCASNQTEFDKYNGYGLIDAEKCVANAKRAKDEPSNIDSIEMKADRISLNEGDDVVLDALVRPATNIAKLSWTSKNKDIAAVDNDGRVIGVASGETEITAGAGGKTVSCKVRVKPAVKVDSIKITGPKDGEIGIGESYELESDIMPMDASNKEMYWEVSEEDKDKLYIDEQGGIKGLKPGKVRVTGYTFAKPLDGTDNPQSAERIKDEIYITVKPLPKKITITKSPKWLTVGKTASFRALLSAGKLKGSEIAHNKVHYYSNDRTVAKINEETGEIKGIKPGVVYITARYAKEENDYGDLCVRKKLIVAKDRYAGKKDYNLKLTGKPLKGKVKLSWKKISVAEGYTIETADKKNGKFKVLKKLNRGDKLSVTVKRKKGGYYRVRAFYKENKIMRYFGYSNIVRAVVK
ncbi:MAG: S8 family serine peptidase [Hornefia sp.]|nr:S8 family serine peptidase [Hornefia sp.]